MTDTFSRIYTWVSFVKFEHTLFSLPLLYAGAGIASGAFPDLRTSLWMRGGGTGAPTGESRAEGGKTAAKIEGGRGGALDVTNIARDGDSLVLSFERSVRGRTIPIVLTLTVDGEMINATQNVGDGRFTVSGSGKKQ